MSLGPGWVKKNFFLLGLQKQTKDRSMIHDWSGQTFEQPIFLSTKYLYLLEVAINKVQGFDSKFWMLVDNKA